MHYVRDELFRTNPLRSPLRAWDLARTLAPMNGAAPPTTMRLLARRLSHAGPLGAARSWVRHRRRGPAAGAGPVLDPAAWDAEEQAAMDALEPLNAQLYGAVHHHHLPHVLRNFERLSMAHGVEVRMPFLDWRLVCFSFGLPPRSKIGGGFAKRVLRQDRVLAADGRLVPGRPGSLGLGAGPDAVVPAELRLGRPGDPGLRRRAPPRGRVAGT
jgi:hypothetical protein